MEKTCLEKPQEKPQENPQEEPSRKSRPVGPGLTLLFLLEQFLFQFVSIIATFVARLGFLRNGIGRSLNKRYQFEMLNDWSDFKPDLCFEASSEGELQLLMPILERFLPTGSAPEESSFKVLLIYSSESLEAATNQLREKYQSSFRAIRIPFVTSEWIRLRQLVGEACFIQARYDFLPSFLKTALRNPSALIGVSFYSRGRVESSFSTLLKKNWLKFCLTHFDLKVFPLKQDTLHIRVLGDQTKGSSASPLVCDFRSFYIQERLDSSAQNSRFQSFSSWYHDQINQAKEDVNYFRKNTLLVGSAHIQDLEFLLGNPNILDQLKKKLISLWIFPHRLDEASLKGIEDKIRSFGIEFQKIDDDFSNTELQSHVVLLPIRGILVEVYTLFEKIYVGGGLGEGVHSVLEPALAGGRIYLPETLAKSSYEVLILEEEFPNQLTWLRESGDLIFKNSEQSSLPAEQNKNQVADYLKRQRATYERIIEWAEEHIKSSTSKPL